MNLPEELVLYIIDNLLSEKDQYSFATISKELWIVATLPRKKKFALTNKISSLNIRRLTHLVVINRFYHPELIAHVLKYATSLSEITFEGEEKLSIKFVQNFMAIEKRCIFTVPAKLFDLFTLVANDSENRYITVKLDSDSEQLDGIKTPEEVERKVQFYKNVEKAKCFENKKIPVQRKDRLTHLVPSHVNRLFNTNEYIIYDNSHSTSEIHSDQQVDHTMLLCQKFMEAVVILDDYWFFSTSFCIFIHSGGIDDCANASQGLPTAITERYDVVYSKNVFIPATDASITRAPRLLNQYIKTHAAKKWMFISTKYEAKGLVPSHPLSFQANNNIQVAASILLKVFVNKLLYQPEIKKAVSKIIPIATPTASNTLVKKYMLDLSSKDGLRFEDYDLMELKRDMLLIYEKTLAEAIKRQNIALVKRAEKEYKPVIIDLTNV